VSAQAGGGSREPTPLLPLFPNVLTSKMLNVQLITKLIVTTPVGDIHLVVNGSVLSSQIIGTETDDIFSRDSIGLK